MGKVHPEKNRQANKRYATGPVTMLQWSFVRHDLPRSEVCRQIWVNPDCGLKTRGWTEIKPALVNLVEKLPASCALPPDNKGKRHKQKWPRRPHCHGLYYYVTNMD